MYKQYLIGLLICFPFMIQAQKKHALEDIHNGSNINLFTDSSNVFPSIRREFLKDVNNVGSKVYNTFWNNNKNPTILSERDISFSLMGFYQEIDKDMSNDTIYSKYFILISTPNTTHGHLLKSMSYSSFLFLVENQETCKWSDLREDTIDPLSAKKPWAKVKSFKRVIKILDFKPFTAINEEFNKIAGN